MIYAAGRNPIDNIPSSADHEEARVFWSNGAAGHGTRPRLSSVPRPISRNFDRGRKVAATETASLVEEYTRRGRMRLEGWAEECRTAGKILLEITLSSAQHCAY